MFVLLGPTLACSLARVALGVIGMHLDARVAAAENAEAQH